MKAKEYQKRKDENLAQWVERIAAMCQGRSLQDVHTMISEVSKTSYIEGVHAEREINRKCFLTSSNYGKR
jgi:hypothetical protein